MATPDGVLAWRRHLLLLLAGALLAACAAPPPSTAPPTPAPSLAPPTARAQPAASAPPTSPSPALQLLPTAAASAIPPSPSPVEPLALRIRAAVDPPTPNAGAEFVLRLSVTNAGDRTAHGVFIATSGPWDRYTVLAIQPAGRFGRDAAGWHIVSPVEVPAGATRTVEVHARADQPSDEQLTFAVREADPGDLS